ncbi:MAG: bifunctional 4-hydroxy-2-oxoglutarate aldolase/2-dehydro-3-deoxy-phosphogluconate aldolase [Clostridia bacterium]|nr:bifunctional 4-hydroxy-2-oxoglutarate aldolase/2-dehydro-3-deoxy-phosphogluconate aldolase [Clostridia bacterium]
MQSVVQSILDEKLIVIVRGVNVSNLLPFAEAVYRGGVRLIECTYDASGKVSDIETAQGIRLLRERFDGRMEIGAGTVLTKEQVLLTKESGGSFIISPDSNPAVIEKTKSEGLVSIPGAFTPTEAVSAHNAGADFVKLFPIGDFGAGYLKSISAPLSHIRFLAVGGVNLSNMKSFIDAGAYGVGIGSDIANKRLISEGSFDVIEELARKYTQALK